MSEVQFLWADQATGKAQVAFSALVHAMFQKDLVALTRFTTRSGPDPKMGILTPRIWEEIDSLTWVQVSSPRMVHHTLMTYTVAIRR
jgi:ATP-dependent DNA helicase 2 subunit 2